MVQLMSWQQRLSALASQQTHLSAALLAALRIYQAAAAGAGQAWQLPQAAWPADGHAAVTLEVQRQLLTILYAYVDQGLAQQKGQGGESAEAAAMQQLAATAIDCCLLVRRPDALWSGIFPRFSRASQRPSVAAADAGEALGAVTPMWAFLQQLLAVILTDQLSSIAPEVRVQAGRLLPLYGNTRPLMLVATCCPASAQVMQALVEHCVVAGHAEQVEACVLKMDLLSLDLNQVDKNEKAKRGYAACVQGGS